MQAFKITYCVCENVINELERKGYIYKIKFDKFYIYSLTQKGINKHLEEFDGNKVDYNRLIKFAEDKNYNLNNFKKYLKNQKKYIDILKHKMTYEEFCILKQYEEVEEDISMSVYLFYVDVFDESELQECFEFKAYCDINNLKIYDSKINIKTK